MIKWAIKTKAENHLVYWQNRANRENVATKADMDMKLKRYFYLLERDEVEERRLAVLDPSLVPFDMKVKDKYRKRVNETANGEGKIEDGNASQLTISEKYSTLDEERPESGVNQIENPSCKRIYSLAKNSPELVIEQDAELARQVVDEVIITDKWEHAKDRNQVMKEIYDHTERKAIYNQEKLIELQKNNLKSGMLDSALDVQIQRIIDLD